jgi:dGTPase
LPWTEQDRQTRLHGDGQTDQRSAFQKDRDRILYSSAFHRLAGITQIVRAGEESVFHTRQQHSIKVAQVGRRLAEARKAEQPELAKSAGLHEEVVEAACLIHDLGHPPFGHIGEATLDKLVVKQIGDGFEGNAQSFRIITKLAVRKEDYAGMNLTMATLAATLKYPWMRGAENTDKGKKWSAYKSEQTDFDFCRNLLPEETKTVEAELMDWADDIAYSVHDLEDFHRCGAVPWAEIFSKKGKQRILDNLPNGAKTAGIEESFDHLKEAIFGLFDEVLRQKYEGTRSQRRVLRSMTSNLIGLYINAIKLVDTNGIVGVEIEQESKSQVVILKQITRDHIISTPSLAAQQIGYKKIIADLYGVFLDSSENKMPDFTPIRLRYLWELSNDQKARFAADCVASLSEDEAMGMHGRLMGYGSGSVLNPIVR